MDIVADFGVRHGRVEVGTEADDVIDVVRNRFMGLEGACAEVLEGLHGWEGEAISCQEHGGGLSPGGGWVGEGLRAKPDGGCVPQLVEEEVDMLLWGKVLGGRKGVEGFEESGDGARAVKGWDGGRGVWVVGRQ